MMCHLFAATYAHQNFSGFHGWENRFLHRIPNGSNCAKGFARDFLLAIPLPRSAVPTPVIPGLAKPEPGIRFSFI